MATSVSRVRFTRESIRSMSSASDEKPPIASFEDDDEDEDEDDGDFEDENEFEDEDEEGVEDEVVDDDDDDDDDDDEDALDWDELEGTATASSSSSSSDASIVLSKRDDTKISREELADILKEAESMNVQVGTGRAKRKAAMNSGLSRNEASSSSSPPKQPKLSATDDLDDEEAEFEF